MLKLSLAAEPGVLVLEVRDDGPGFPPGFNLADCQGLGLGLVVALARQIGGTFSYRNDGGAVFTLRFPG